MNTALSQVKVNPSTTPPACSTWIAMLTFVLVQLHFPLMLLGAVKL